MSDCKRCEQPLSKTYWEDPNWTFSPVCGTCHDVMFEHSGLIGAERVTAPDPVPLRDLKEALGSSSKPDLTHCRRSLMVYAARACEYGSAKYERANYLRPVEGPQANFERLRAYLRACASHLMCTLDSMERHQASDPGLQDASGLERAAYAPDMEAGATFPASELPHLAHAAASLMMALEQATASGLLPDDPGRPWEKR
jgi:hypothetical protein